MTPELLEKLVPIVADRDLANALKEYAVWRRTQLTTQVLNVTDLNGLGRIQGELRALSELEQLPERIRDAIRDQNAKR